MEFHGGTMDESVIDFSISVNSYMPTWKDQLFKRCAEISNKYLYVEWIEERFKEKFGKDTVILAGATEAFQIVGFTIMNDANVVIPLPSYGEYERIASYMAKRVFKVPSKNEIDLNLDSAFDLAKKLSNNGKSVIILGNPNNPTGKYLKMRDDLEDLANKVTIVLDEAFVDFVDEKLRWNVDHPNIIIVRSFTKSYGMPGVRVGYVKTENFKKHFEKYRSPWALGSCGYAFVEFLIEDDGTFLFKSMQSIKAESKKFENFGIFTDANFGVLKVKNAHEVQKNLDKLGIHVRNCESFGLYDRIRVSIRKTEENERLFESLRKVIR
ncbi:MAG: aminotransferase class I/II-fold pyridoxal phosphate-dependent enzyme [Thermotogae bacterium]|jgi:histidinol-phosphate aminotransferase|nr:aminotransferase class I/II-fold pyridoxal phosphate-dependent enzyme [Thermotogota bacterium]